MNGELTIFCFELIAIFVLVLISWRICIGITEKKRKLGGDMKMEDGWIEVDGIRIEYEESEYDKTGTMGNVIITNDYGSGIEVPAPKEELGSFIRRTKDAINRGGHFIKLPETSSLWLLNEKVEIEKVKSGECEIRETNDSFFIPTCVFPGRKKTEIKIPTGRSRKVFENFGMRDRFF